MYYSALDLLAVLILLIENQDILRNKNGVSERPDWRSSRRFLITVLIYFFTDALWGILEYHKLSYALFADTTIYFIVMALGILCWTQYAVIYLEERNRFGQFLVYAGRIMAGLVTVLVIVNLFVPVYFTVDDTCVYRGLPGRYVMLIAQIVLLLLVSGYAVSAILQRRDEAKKRNKYRTLALFGLVMAIFLTVQLWFPYLPLYAIAYLLGTCLLHTFVISDEKEEYKRGLEEAARIRELKESITSLLDHMPGMSFSKDAETGVYLACNQAFAEYAHKADPSGVAGLTDAEIFDPETAAHFVEDDRMALSMDQPYIFFEDVPDAAGNPRQFQTTKLKFIDTDGRLCLLGLCADVTDMVRIQREQATTKEAYERARSTGIMYSHIAQALARGYADLYYVDLDTEEYIEYRTDSEADRLYEARRGAHFFDECRIEVNQYVHPDDRAAFAKAMDRDTLLDTLDRNRTFMMTYRLLEGDGAIYVRMKISRMTDDDRFLIIGVTDVDEEMKQRRAAERVKEERIAYARINALVGDFLCVYIVVPETGFYREYSTSAGFEAFALPKVGEDFFRVTREQSRRFIHPDDQDRFLSLFTREGVLSEIARSGIFALSYCLMMDGKPVHVRLKAAMAEEKEGRRLVVGINDIESHVRQEAEYERRLAQAHSKAHIDALTGVKSRHAYLDAEALLDRQIAEHRQTEFAIVILDVNDLKKVNDTSGHQAGDQYLRDACGIICGIFEHSPVFRVGGDEFAVIAEGSDYARIEELMGKVADHNDRAVRSGGIVIACGMAKLELDGSVAPVFERADLRMYENKSKLKAVPENGHS